jgi:SAM-dependent methyltransferase
MSSENLKPTPESIRQTAAELLKSVEYTDWLEEAEGIMIQQIFEQKLLNKEEEIGMIPDRYFQSFNLDKELQNTHGVLIDVGCGYGKAARAIQNKYSPNLRVIGIEPILSTEQPLIPILKGTVEQMDQVLQSAPLPDEIQVQLPAAVILGRNSFVATAYAAEKYGGNFKYLPHAGLLAAYNSLGPNGKLLIWG